MTKQGQAIMSSGCTVMHQICITRANIYSLETEGVKNFLPRSPVLCRFDVIKCSAGPDVLLITPIHDQLHWLNVFERVEWSVDVSRIR